MSEAGEQRKVEEWKWETVRFSDSVRASEWVTKSHALAYAESATKGLLEQLSEARKEHTDALRVLNLMTGEMLKEKERAEAAAKALASAAKLEREACIAIVENSYNSKVAVAKIRERGEGR